MSQRQFSIGEGERGVALTIRVVPRAKKDEISEVLADGTLKIRLKAPPVDGKANQALVSFLAKTFGVAKNKVEIVAGFKGRKKIVSILDIDRSFVESRLKKII